MPRSWASDLITHLSGELLTIAFGFDIIPRDLGSFHFTDHDDDVLVGTNLYLSRVGFERDALTSKDDFSADNTQVRGIFDDEGLKEDDLIAGRYDFAEVRIFLFNYVTRTQVGKVLRGRIGRVRHLPSGVFDAELRGLSELLLQRIGRVYSSECDTDLGDPVRCKIPIQPELVVRNKFYDVDEFVRVRTLSSPTEIPIPITNAGGESLTGWTEESGDAAATVLAGLAPTEGTFYFVGNAGSMTFHISQLVDVSALVGFNPANVDLGRYAFSLTGDRGNGPMNTTDVGRLSVDAVTETGNFIKKIFSTGFEVISPPGAFQGRGCTAVPVPAGTRGLVFRFEGIRPVAGTCVAALDNLIATLLEYGAPVDQGAFENLIYRVITAGVTDTVEPTYDTVVGNTTNDGDAVLEAVEAWTRDAEVSDVVDGLTVEIDVDEPRAVDGWFAAGVVTPESGPNMGISMEVKGWIGASEQLTLYDRFPFPLTVGVRLRISPGCMKRWIEDCRDKFDNVLNFQGIPDASGADAVKRFKIP